MQKKKTNLDILNDFFDNYEETSTIHQTPSLKIANVVKLNRNSPSSKIGKALNAFCDCLKSRHSHPYLVSKFVKTGGVPKLGQILESLSKKSSEYTQRYFEAINLLLDCESSDIYTSIANDPNLLKLIISKYGLIRQSNVETKDSCLTMLARIALYHCSTQAQACHYFDKYMDEKIKQDKERETFLNNLEEAVVNHSLVLRHGCKVIESYNREKYRVVESLSMDNISNNAYKIAIYGYYHGCMKDSGKKNNSNVEIALLSTDICNLIFLYFHEKKTTASCYVYPKMGEIQLKHHNSHLQSSVMTKNNNKNKTSFKHLFDPIIINRNLHDSDIQFQLNTDKKNIKHSKNWEGQSSTKEFTLYSIELSTCECVNQSYSFVTGLLGIDKEYLAENEDAVNLFSEKIEHGISDKSDKNDKNDQNDSSDQKKDSGKNEENKDLTQLLLGYMKDSGLESKYEFRGVYMCSTNYNEWSWHFFNESNKMVGRPSESDRGNWNKLEHTGGKLNVVIEKRSLIKKKNYGKEYQFSLCFRNLQVDNERIGYMLNQFDNSLQIRDDKMSLDHTKYQYYPLFACDGCHCVQDEYRVCYQISFQE